jgi:hypothetical protein
VERSLLSAARTAAVGIAAAAMFVGLAGAGVSPAKQSAPSTCPANMSLTASPGPFVADGHDGPEVLVAATDTEGRGVPGRPLFLLLLLEGHVYASYDVKDRGGGAYEARVDSRLAGDGFLSVTDMDCLVGAEAPVSFEPGVPHSVEVTATDPRAEEPRNVSILTARVVDRMGNVVPRLESDLVFTSDLGTLGPIEADPSGELHVPLTWEELGTATVEVVDTLSGKAAHAEVAFPAIYLGCTPVPPITDLGVNGTVFALPLILTPPSGSFLARYEVSMRYDPTNVEVVSVADPDPNDPFPTPSVDHVRRGEIRLFQNAQVTLPGQQGPRSLAVALIQFRALAGGLERLRVDGSLFDQGLNPIAEGAPVVPCELLKQDKPLNKLCVNVIVQKDAFADLATAKTEAEKDIKKAQEVFDKNVRLCCPRIKFEFNKDEDITEKERPGGNSPPESLVDLWRAKHELGGWKEKKSDRPCINIYYFKDFTLKDDATIIGDTQFGAATDCNKEKIKATKEALAKFKKLADAGNPIAPGIREVFKNQPSVGLDAKDRKPLTAAHEIGHLLGLPEAQDDPTKPPPKGNVMNAFADQAGDAFTDKQCKCVTEGKAEYEKGELPFKKDP